MSLTIKLLLLSLISFHVNAANYGYKVSSSSKTVIQIARDIYNDQRQWKNIAYWNNLEKPYQLNAGQILVLPKKPIAQLSPENQVAESEVPEPNFAKQKPSVKQMLTKNGTVYNYVVNERAPSLSMIALENYGNIKMATLIAKWNNLPIDAKLSLEQSILLKVKPVTSPQQATKILISLWKKAKNEDMVSRLSHKENNSTIITKKSEKIETEIKPTTKTAVAPEPTLKADEVSEPAEEVEPVIVNEPIEEVQPVVVTEPVKEVTEPSSPSEKQEPTKSTPVAEIKKVEIIPPPIAAVEPAKKIETVIDKAEETKTSEISNSNKNEIRDVASVTNDEVSSESKESVKTETTKTSTSAALSEPTTDQYWLGETNSVILKNISDGISEKNNK